MSHTQTISTGRLLITLLDFPDDLDAAFCPSLPVFNMLKRLVTLRISQISLRDFSSTFPRHAPSFVNQDFESLKDNDAPETDELPGAKFDVSYPGHIQITPFQRLLLSSASGLGCILRPQRDDLIATFGESSGGSALRWMLQKMREDEVGLQILAEQPRIRSSTVDLEALRLLEEGTLGKSYVNFLDKYGYSPDSRRAVQFVDDPELAYVMLRYREIHDLNHVILEQPTNMLGEVVVKWFEAFQTRLPLCVTGALLGPIRLFPKQRQRYINVYLPYILRVGRDAKSVMCYYFEKNWEKPLSVVREELNIEAPP